MSAPSGLSGIISALAVGSWQLAVGSWQLAVGSWQLAVGSWQLAVGSWQLNKNTGFIHCNAKLKSNFICCIHLKINC